MDSGQKMSKGFSRYSFYWRHFIDDILLTTLDILCRILSDDVIFCRLLTDDVIILITEDDVILSITEDDVIMSITEDDVILSITEDDGINYIQILYLYTE